MTNSRNLAVARFIYKITMEKLTALKALVMAGCGSRRAYGRSHQTGTRGLNGASVSSFKQELGNLADVLTLDGKQVALKNGGTRLSYPQ